MDKTKHLLDLIHAATKAEAIIESCVTHYHFENALNYIQLFNKKFCETPDVFTHLNQLLNDKKKEKLILFDD